MQCVSSPITHQSKSWQCRTKGVSKWDLYCMQMFILIFSWSVSVYFVLFSLMSFPPNTDFILFIWDVFTQGFGQNWRKEDVKFKNREPRDNGRKSNPTTLKPYSVTHYTEHCCQMTSFLSFIFLPWLSQWQMIDDCSSIENPIYGVKVERLRPPEKGSSLAVIIENIPWKNAHFFCSGIEKARLR